MNRIEILNNLKKLENLHNKAGMKRFGINTEKAFGINIPILRDFAKNIKKNHPLSLELWETGFHEARLLAIFIDDYKLVTEKQMEKWVKDFNSWDICDQACAGLFDKHSLAPQKAIEWSQRESEFEKRAGFAMMATLAVHNKKAENSFFTNFFPYIEMGAKDNRNFVKKAVNWEIRQIGKRNKVLNKESIILAEKIKLQNSKSSNWISTDAIRELTSEKLQERLK